MNTKHAPSFILSIFIHLGAALIVYFTYQFVISLKKEQKKEELICMSLCSYKIKPPKKIIIPKKIIYKKVPPKKTIPKKKIQKKIKPIQKKVTVPIVKKIKPQKIIKTKIVESVVLETPKKDVIEQNVTVVEPEIQEIIEETTKEPQYYDEIEEKVEERYEEKYINNHLDEISQLLVENLYYPRRARKRGMVGEVIVKFTLYKNGEVDFIEIVSSKYDILSRAAIKTIENLSGEFPKPEEELQLQIPIVYSLSNN